jgi:hypothetical protein
VVFRDIHRVFCWVGTNISEELLSPLTAADEDGILFRNVSYHSAIVITPEDVTVSRVLNYIYYCAAEVGVLRLKTLKDRITESSLEWQKNMAISSR